MKVVNLISKRAIERRYYRKNREKKLALVKAWQEKNPEKVKKYSRDFYANNKSYWVVWHKDRVAKKVA